MTAARGNANVRPAGYSDSDSDSSEFEFSSAFKTKSNRAKVPLPSRKSVGRPSASQGRSWGWGDDEEVDHWKEPEATPAQKLRQAISKKDVQLTTELVNQKSVPINQTFDDGWSPLLTAASVASPALVDFLLKAGADAGQSTPDGFTCLMAVSNRSSDPTDSLETVRLLLQAEANVNASNIHGMTPLMFAAREKQATLLEAFLDAGASIDQQNNLGATSLILAAERGFGREVRVLLSRNANIRLTTEQGSSAYESAQTAKHDKIADMIYLVETTNWRPGLNPQLKLKKNEDQYDDRFQDVRQIQSKIIQKNQIDMILEQLGLEIYKNKFTEHEIEYLDFLMLSDEDLVEVGIADAKSRATVLEAVQDIRSRDYPNSTVLPLRLQKNLDPSESLCLVMETKKHLETMVNHVKWLDLRVRTDPRMLECRLEIYGLDNMINQTIDTQRSLDVFIADLKNIQASV